MHKASHDQKRKQKRDSRAGKSPSFGQSTQSFMLDIVYRCGECQSGSRTAAPHKLYFASHCFTSLQVTPFTGCIGKRSAPIVFPNEPRQLHGISLVGPFLATYSIRGDFPSVSESSCGHTPDLRADELFQANCARVPHTLTTFTRARTCIELQHDPADRFARICRSDRGP